MQKVKEHAEYIAGDFATRVKLTRTLSIIPIVLIFVLIEVHLKKKAAFAAGNV